MYYNNRSISTLIKPAGKHKAVPVHAIKAYGGSGGIALIIINLVARWQ
jgi:hypothetical protein